MCHIIHGERTRGYLLLQVSLRIHRQRNHCDFLDVSFLSSICNIRTNKLRFLFTISTWLSNVHTLAMFFLWHLVNMSCMVPFWASTDSGSVPIWGPRPKPRLRRRLFIFLVTAAHILPNVFSLQKFLSNTRGLFLTVQYIAISFILIFTSHLYPHSHLYLHVLSISSFLLIFVVGWLPSNSCVRYSKYYIISWSATILHLMSNSLVVYYTKRGHFLL